LNGIQSSPVDSVLATSYKRVALPPQRQAKASTNGTDIRMATRQARIDDFVHDGMPPGDQSFELLCEDFEGRRRGLSLCGLRMFRT